MTNKSNEERIERLEKIVEKQHELIKAHQDIIKRMVSTIPFSKEGRAFIFNKTKNSGKG